MTRRVVAVAGGIATGKSTLAEGLARHLGWPRIAATPLALDYLELLFADMPRWALETQAAFAIDKARELRRAQEANVDTIVERTLTEDIEIYAAFFLDHGFISGPSARLYIALASELSRGLPPPDVVIVCQATLGTIQRRVADRDRAKDRLYPEGHIEEISQRYTQLNAATLGSLVYSVDGERYDWRQEDVLTEIASEVSDLCFALHTNPLQMAMPWVSGVTGEAIRAEQILRPVNPRSVAMQAHGLDAHDAEPWLAQGKRMVYIAAPFTSEEAIPEDRSNTARLFAHRGRARIGRSVYRAALLDVAAALRKHGLEPLLPHRDISRWGDAQLTERDIAVACTKAVLDCDLFLGMLGKSPGAHYECGLAVAAGKPVILVTCDDLNDSTIAQGVSGIAALRRIHAGPLLSLRVTRLTDVPDLLKGPEVSEFIAHWLPQRSVR